tara:strand:- start:1435 stop:2460 length:1026 start_codon:yes stop_codon:yes gene_type:complete
VYKGLFISSGFHLGIIIISIFTLPFIAKKPIDIPPLISVELIQISDITNIPYAPKAKKIIDKVKEKNEKLLSEQAPPKKIKKEENKKVNLDKKKDNIKKEENKKVNLDKKKINIDQSKTKKNPTPENKKDIVKKEKLEAIPMPDKKKEKIIAEEEKQQQPSKELKKDAVIKKLAKTKKPIKEDAKVKQVSEFEKKELFDPSNIASLIDKSKEDLGETNKKTDKITQSQDNTMMDVSKLTLSEEDALKAQIFGCWSIPLGLPYNEDLLVRIKLKLKPDGTLIKTEVIDHARMNMPGQKFYKVLAESALRAIQLCQPLKVPTSGYERWKNLQLNFDPREMLGG